LFASQKDLYHLHHPTRTAHIICSTIMSSPNNSSGANLVTPPESSVKVNTEHICSNGRIATGLITILKEVDISYHKCK